MDVLPLGVSGWPSRNDVRDDGRKGVAGREEGLGRDVERARDAEEDAIQQLSRVEPMYKALPTGDCDKTALWLDSGLVLTVRIRVPR